jgi:parallel beta-helix repeat protein
MIILTLLAFAQAPLPPSSPTPPPSSFYWFDLDGDGDQDALAIEPGGSLRLLRNQGAGSFADDTLAAGLAEVAGAKSALIGDYDLDGSDDLVLAGAGGLRLLRQAGGVFVDVTSSAGLADLGPIASTGWVDANGDGRPDLHLVGWGSHRVFANEAAGLFRELDLGSSETAHAGVVVSAGSGAPTVAGHTNADERSPRERDRGAPERSATSSRTAASDPSDPAPRGGGSPGSGGGIDFAFCPSGINDAAVGTCVSASSVPTLGMLYPLGNEFSIDAVTGNVGVGTTTPGYALEVAGQIVSGTGNTAAGLESALGGGKLNAASGDQSTIAGGESNSATAQGAFVGGGLLNSALSSQAAIAGGVGNRATYRSFVGGGDNNAAIGNLTTVAGGKLNESRQMGDAVGGGELNIADATHATIAGGFANSATGAKTSIGGGESNVATGAYGSVPGGRQNTAGGAYSQAAGRRAKAVHDGAFVWADSTDADFASTAADQFLVRAAGGMGLGMVPDPSFQLDVAGAVRATDTFVSTKALGAPFSVASSELNANLNADFLDGLDASAFSQFGFAVDTGEIATDAVTADKIAPFAVGVSELGFGAVNSSKLAIGAVSTNRIAADAVTSSKIAAGAVDSAALAADAVGTPNVLDGAVTLPKLDASAGSVGQVLGHNGSNVAWATLPNASWTPISALPYTVVSSGSYYLTGNLTGVSGSDGIVVIASDVTIHLNGFSLIGVPESEYGISGFSADRTTVIGGTVQNWPFGGVALGENGAAYRVMARDNGLLGFYCSFGQYALLVDCLADGNGTSGFSVADGTVLNCVATNNGQSGFKDTGKFWRCRAFHNGGSGFGVLNSEVSHCVAGFNGTSGFQARESILLNNVAYQHGSGAGILLYNQLGHSGCRVEGNDVSENSIGIDAQASGNLIIRNSAWGNTTDYSIPSGNSYGQILSTSGVITSSNAWANFSY